MDGCIRGLTLTCRILLPGPVERSVLHMLLCSRDGRSNPTAKWAPRAAMLSASLGMPSDSSQWGPEGTLFVEQAVLAVRSFSRTRLRFSCNLDFADPMKCYRVYDGRTIDCC